MPVGPTPENQLRALPILTQQQIAAPGEAVVIGGQVIRYWSPSQLGLNGVSGNVADPDNVPSVAADVSMFTNYVDGRGCNAFTLMLVNDPFVAPAGETAWHIYLQYAGTGSVGLVQPRSGTAGRIVTSQVALINFGIAAGPLTAYTSWSNGNDSTNVASNRPVAAGIFRIWLNRNPGHASTWYASLWGVT
jgi:hypothetical protein